MRASFLKKIKFLFDALYWLFKILMDVSGSISNLLLDYLDYEKNNGEEKKTGGKKRGVSAREK